jgi:hypothetical protein
VQSNPRRPALQLLQSLSMFQFKPHRHNPRAMDSPNREEEEEELVNSPRWWQSWLSWKRSIKVWKEVNAPS